MIFDNIRNVLYMMINSWWCNINDDIWQYHTISGMFSIMYSWYILFMIVFMVCIPQFCDAGRLSWNFYWYDSIGILPQYKPPPVGSLCAKTRNMRKKIMGFSYGNMSVNGRNWNKYMVNGKYMAFCSSFFIRLNGNTWWSHGNVHGISIYLIP